MSSTTSTVALPPPEGYVEEQDRPPAPSSGEPGDAPDSRILLWESTNRWRFAPVSTY